MKRSLATAVILLALSVAACGGDTAEPATTTSAGPTAATSTSTTQTATTTTAAFPVTLGSGPDAVTLTRAPQRIAALSASHVEMLFAIGAGDRVIAGDLFSDHPPEASGLTRIDSFNLSVESVIDLDPDLVVLSFDPGGVVDGLTAVGIPVLVFPTPASLEDALGQMLDLGSATGHATGASEAAAAVTQRVEEAVASVGGRGAGVSFYHETDPFTFYTPDSDSFLGSLYDRFGMVNIADAASGDVAGGFPQLSAEYIIASDPDIVFLGSSGYGETPETVAARPGWETMTAVREGRIVPLDPDVASRWGPRVADLVEAIAAAVVEHAP